MDAPLSHTKNCLWMLTILGIILYVADQVTKFLIVWNFAPPGYLGMASADAYYCIPVIQDYFNIIRVHNTGVAFGMGNGTAWSIYVFLLIPIIAIMAIIFGFMKNFFNTGWLKLAGTLLLTGICGNLTDRIVQGFITWGDRGAEWTSKGSILYGYVVDFIDVTIPVIHYRWPSFNIADSCICIAAAIFFFHGLFHKHTPSHHE